MKQLPEFVHKQPNLGHSKISDGNGKSRQLVAFNGYIQQAEYSCLSFHKKIYDFRNTEHFVKLCRALFSFVACRNQVKFEDTFRKGNLHVCMSCRTEDYVCSLHQLPLSTQQVGLVQTCARVSVRIFGYFSHKKYTQENPLISTLDNMDW